MSYFKAWLVEVANKIFLFFATMWAIPAEELAEIGVLLSLINNIISVTEWVFLLEEKKLVSLSSGIFNILTSSTFVRSMPLLQSVVDCPIG